MIRQDAWNQDEDLLLAETVLKHIREGGTQLAAFEEVADKLSRTSAACGFRWNSSVRKKYDSAIQLAKKARKESKRNLVRNQKTFIPNESKQTAALTNGLSQRNEKLKWFDQMIGFLEKEKEKVEGKDHSDELFLQELKKENDLLKKELTNLKEAYTEIKEEYQLMIHAVQRATKKDNESRTL
ncbi:RsfA family transcriptional regulator [Salipaludibacillus aurantiacus]|uniref:Prespore-specific regulator n=1 Tax=Salipaludibacillus aurantiacus TaxID=1601833 RepID=A0A1H9QUL8_9BACI|nr:RsfA family transcriptional regulator [Salipaludibacillus aurantiacus]SER64172.1 prespore-specific regulator [Salipaludibacillus aurantiacus]